jgi:hypothetical protein
MTNETDALWELRKRTFIIHFGLDRFAICPDCKGERRVGGHLCKRCKGNAQVPRSELKPGEMGAFEEHKP